MVRILLRFANLEKPLTIIQRVKKSQLNGPASMDGARGLPTLRRFPPPVIRAVVRMYGVSVPLLPLQVHKATATAPRVLTRMQTHRHTFLSLKTL